MWPGRCSQEAFRRLQRYRNRRRPETRRQIIKSKAITGVGESQCPSAKKQNANMLFQEGGIPKHPKFVRLVTVIAAPASPMVIPILLWTGNRGSVILHAPNSKKASSTPSNIQLEPCLCGFSGWCKLAYQPPKLRMALYSILCNEQALKLPNS